MSGKRTSLRTKGIACDVEICRDDSPKEVTANPAPIQIPVEYNYFESSEIKHGECIELSIFHDYTNDDVFIVWFCKRTNGKVTNYTDRNNSTDNLCNFEMTIRDDNDYGEYYFRLHSNSDSKIIFNSKKISITKPTPIFSNKMRTNSRRTKHNNMQTPQQQSRKDPEQGLHQNQISNTKQAHQNCSQYPLQSEKESPYNENNQIQHDQVVGAYYNRTNHDNNNLYPMQPPQSVIPPQQQLPGLDPNFYHASEDIHYLTRPVQRARSCVGARTKINNIQHKPEMEFNNIHTNQHALIMNLPQQQPIYHNGQQHHQLAFTRSVSPTQYGTENNFHYQNQSNQTQQHQQQQHGMENNYNQGYQMQQPQPFFQNQQHQQPQHGMENNYNQGHQMQQPPQALFQNPQYPQQQPGMGNIPNQSNHNYPNQCYRITQTPPPPPHQYHGMNPYPSNNQAYH